MINSINYSLLFKSNRCATNGISVAKKVCYNNCMNTENLSKSDVGNIIAKKSLGVPEVIDTMMYEIGHYLNESIDFEMFSSKYPKHSEEFIKLMNFGKNRESYIRLYPKEIDLLKKVNTDCYNYNHNVIGKEELDKLLENNARDYVKTL